MYKPSIILEESFIKKLTANILFSGIGAQEKGFNNSGLFEIDVVTTSDINKAAVLSYAAIHCGLTQQMISEYKNYPSRQVMAQYLTDINLGYVPEKDEYYDWFKLVKHKNNALEKYWLACKLTNNQGDINRIETLPYADLWTISFCCQDISVAGKMKGFKPDSGTRSSLLWKNIELLNKAKEKDELPQYVMFENVKNLVSKRFINDFNDLLAVMDELGFNSYWKVLNAKDCGVAQNRERVFAICIRKDIDTKSFDFPTPFDNGLRLKDFLDDEVAEKYYLSELATRKFKLFSECKGSDIKVAGSFNPDKNVQDRVRVLDVEGISQGSRATDYKDPVKITTGIDKSINNTKEIEYANCITTREDRGVSNRKSEGTAILEQVGQIYGTEVEPNPQAGRVYNAEFLSPTLDTCKGGNRMPKILEKNIVNGAIRGRYNEDGNIEQKLEIGNSEKTNTLTTVQKDNVIVEEKFIIDDTQGFEDEPRVYDSYSPTLRSKRSGLKTISQHKIRKLTPKECYRLMGFADKDIDSAYELGVADCQLYSQAGNSIVTNCVELLAEHLYKAQYDNTYICKDENFTQPQAE